MNTSKPRKFKTPSVEGNRHVDRSVVKKYEQLVESARGGFIIIKGADYRIAPPVGTSKLLARSILGES